MLDLVYICRFDYLSWCHIREESAVPQAHVPCNADQAEALKKQDFRSGRRLRKVLEALAEDEAGLTAEQTKPSAMAANHSMQTKSVAGARCAVGRADMGRVRPRRSSQDRRPPA